MSHIDLYCERLGPEFWAEPINALTNVSFLLAALGIWRFSRSMGARSPGIVLLILIAAAIGIGSFLFHTFATRWALYFDVVPILVFQLVFLWLYCRDVIGFSRALSAVLLAGFFVVALVFRQFPGVLNGSLIYLPALCVILFLGAYHALAVSAERFELLWAGAVLAFSLVCRSIDNMVCPSFQHGTHFLWHLANGLVIYLAARAYVRYRALTGAQPASP